MAEDFRAGAEALATVDVAAADAAGFDLEESSVVRNIWELELAHLELVWRRQYRGQACLRHLRFPFAPGLMPGLPRAGLNARPTLFRAEQPGQGPKS